MLNLQLQH